MQPDVYGCALISRMQIAAACSPDLDTDADGLSEGMRNCWARGGWIGFGRSVICQKCKMAWPLYLPLYSQIPTIRLNPPLRGGYFRILTHADTQEHQASMFAWLA